ncbi:hypothetical protein ACIOWE_21710 [Pseudomonas sp. NPDC087598]|uniref:hypothetical protein n=1 Tax=Pseudomonas sp. NPDC087598 TaxID=3364440 RepID=UPI00382347F0
MNEKNRLEIKEKAYAERVEVPLFKRSLCRYTVARKHREMFFARSVSDKKMSGALWINVLAWRKAQRKSVEPLWVGEPAAQLLP